MTIMTTSALRLAHRFSSSSRSSCCRAVMIKPHHQQVLSKSSGICNTHIPMSNNIVLPSTANNSSTVLMRTYSSGNRSSNNNDSDGNNGNNNSSSNNKRSKQALRDKSVSSRARDSNGEYKDSTGAGGSRCSDGSSGDGRGGRGGGGGGGGGMFVDQNERMRRIFDRLKERLPADMKQHFEPGSVNYHISKTLVLLMDEKYLKLLPRAIEEFDRAIELAQQQRQFAFVDTIGQTFLRDQLTMHGGRRGYELVLSLLMGLLHERKEPHDALRIYNSILDMEGVIAETYYCRGICYMRGVADYHRAKEDLQMAVRIRSDFYQAYDQLGVLQGTLSMVHDSPQAHKSNYESALRLFDRAIEINAQYAPAYTNRGVVLMESEPHRALQDFERSLQLDDLSAYTHQQMGVLYMDHIKKHDRALHCFNRALQLQPHNPTLFQFRAMLFQKLGRIEEAHRDLQTAQEVYEDLQRDLTVSKHY